MAYKIPVTKENIRLLKEFMSIQDLGKAEMDVAAIPRIVKPYNDSAKEIATIVATAFATNSVHRVKLNGKHSAGSALIHDAETDTVWLLKPGSGKLSNAAGIKEENASQSRREVAFNSIAKVLGLGKYVPRAALLLLDSQEVAALEFFSGTYKTLDKLRNNSDFDLPVIFEKMVQNRITL